MEKNFNDIYDNAGFSNDFFFCKILENRPDLCAEIIRILTKYEAEKIIDVRTQLSQQNPTTGKGNVVLRDKNFICNLKMRTANNNNFPKQNRYNQDMVDTSFLDDDYCGLQKNFIILICTSDPFKENRYIYTYKCIDKKIGEETWLFPRIIFFNTEGTKDASEEIKNLADYIAGRSIKGKLAEELDREVKKVKQDEKCRLEFIQKYNEEEIYKKVYEKNYVKFYEKACAKGYAEDYAKFYAEYCAEAYAEKCANPASITMLSNLVSSNIITVETAVKAINMDV